MWAYVGVWVVWFSVVNLCWCMLVYVGVRVVWFSVVNHMMVYVCVCGCMRGVVQCGEPSAGVCGCMCVYVWCGSVL
jgi:hypothetical protein